MLFPGLAKALSAIVHLEHAGGSNTNPIELIQNVYWEPTLFNLGHAYRKDDAIRAGATVLPTVCGAIAG
jgi:hypothetical protein